MKSIFLILITVFMLGSVDAVQPVRKPFLQIKIDGKSYKNGDIIFVKPGQKLLMEVELEGGRRDYCKFPDIYADIAGTAEILSRGENGLSYQIKGTKAEWNLLSENITYTADPYIKVNNLSKPSSAKIGEFINAYTQSGSSNTELVVSTNSFSQTFVKIAIKTIWQFTQEGKTSDEGNVGEGILYFKIAGTSDIWYASQNIQASGMKNDLVNEKLDIIQAACDSIENNIIKLKFSNVQSSVKTLQNAVNDAKATLDELNTNDPTYQTSVVFLGLPSDKPYKDISDLSKIKSSWISFQSILIECKEQMGTLPANPTKESKDILADLIGKCVDWQYQLPENTFKILPVYMPDLNAETIQIPGNIHFIAEEKNVTNYTQTLKDFNTYLDRRNAVLPDEIQKIGSTQSRLQAVRLFDGMLRSYFSSINWAEWKNTRE